MTTRTPSRPAPSVPGDGALGALPEGPRLPASVQAVGYHRDPLGVLRRLRAHLGPVFTLRFPLKDPLVIADVPAQVPQLLDADPSSAEAGVARRTVLPQASARSPFGGDGAAHSASRARMWPAFSPERMSRLEPAIAELSESCIEGWPTRRPFRLLEATRSLCTEITVRLVLAVTDERRATRLVAAIRGMLNSPGSPPLPLPGGLDGPAGILGAAGDRVFARRSAPVRQMLDEELAARRHEAGADDLLAAMLASEPSLSNQEIVNELLIVLMAAQEPPAIALANVLYELAGRPGTTDAFLAMPSLRRSIVAEVLRLRPSAQAALRRLKVPTQVGEQLLPAGTTLALPSLLLHRDPVAFPEPDEFRAKRFADATGPPRPYLPFGGGARRCIGEALAEAEFRAVLPAALRRLRFARTWPREERMVVRATVLVPCRSALVAAAPR